MSKKISNQDKPLNEAVIGLEVQYQGQFDKAMMQAIANGTKKLLHDIDARPNK